MTGYYLALKDNIPNITAGRVYKITEIDEDLNFYWIIAADDGGKIVVVGVVGNDFKTDFKELPNE